jgi:hypothetical protein
MSFISKAAIALTLGFTAVIAQAGIVPVNLVSNPGFEVGSGSGSKATGWSGNRRSGSAERSGMYGAMLDREDGKFETISQTIKGLTVGSHYTLSFWLKWDREESGELNTFKYDFGRFKNQSLQIDPQPFYWTLISKDFTANKNSMLLKFYGRVKDDKNAWYLDDVSLVAKNGTVPLPATLPLMGLGLLGLGLGLARRARRAA